MIHSFPFLVESGLPSRPQVLNWVEIWQVWRPFHDDEAVGLKKVISLYKGMNKGIVLLKDKFSHRGHYNRIIERLLEAIETFNEGEEAVFEGGDVVRWVNASLWESKQRAKLVITETTPHHDRSSISLQGRHKTVVMEPFLLSSEDPNYSSLLANFNLAFIWPNNPPPIINCLVLTFLTKFQSLTLMIIGEEGLFDSDVLLDTDDREATL